ncbi:hypothetical protein ACFQE7_33055 [Nonomuraea ferruginea]|uniref:hypothetical protein n=1 Tax=Nonomuraea ferruginea TaxID=46174 RepID=UPI003621AFFC
MATDGTPLCPKSKEKAAVNNPTRDERMPSPAHLVITGDIRFVYGEGGSTYVRHDCLIVLMVVAVTAMELIMRSSPEGKESVESPFEIVGD